MSSVFNPFDIFRHCSVLSYSRYCLHEHVCICACCRHVYFCICVFHLCWIYFASFDSTIRYPIRAIVHTCMFAYVRVVGTCMVAYVHVICASSISHLSTLYYLDLFALLFTRVCLHMCVLPARHLLDTCRSAIPWPTRGVVDTCILVYVHVICASSISYVSTLQYCDLLVVLFSLVRLL